MFFLLLLIKRNYKYKMDPKICAYALGHLNHHIQNNRISACYRCVTKLGDYKTQVLSDIFNSPAATRHRKTLMSGKWPSGCKSCKEFEEAGLLSTRLEGLKHPELGLNLDDYDHNTGKISHIKSIEIRFGNECNLACRHCSPNFSSKWESLLKQHPTEWQPLLGREPEIVSKNNTHPNYFNDILTNLVPQLTHIAFSGGETLFQQQHYDFINAIPAEHASHIQLLYVTNGTITEYKQYKVFDIWKKFKSVNIVVSTDGVLDRFNYFRQGANWITVEKNMKIFKDAGFNVYTEITCSVYQMFYLAETIDYIYESKISGAISSAIVQYPPLLNPRIIPSEIKNELIEKWNQYLLSINDPVKLEAVKLAGNYPIDYMRGDLSDFAYGLPYNIIPTWRDFSNHVYALDKLFNKNVNYYMPELSKHLLSINVSN